MIRVLEPVGRRETVGGEKQPFLEWSGREREESVCCYQGFWSSEEMSERAEKMREEIEGRGREKKWSSDEGEKIYKKAEH